jgi:hypothetical protein
MHGALPVLLNVPGAQAWPNAVAFPIQTARQHAPRETSERID